MIRFDPWLIALSVVAPACLFAPGAAQAQAPGQPGFLNKSDFRDYDSFLFNYRAVPARRSSRLRMSRGFLPWDPPAPRGRVLARRA